MANNGVGLDKRVNGVTGGQHGREGRVERESAARRKGERQRSLDLREIPSLRESQGVACCSMAEKGWKWRSLVRKGSMTQGRRGGPRVISIASHPRISSRSVRLCQNHLAERYPS